MTNFLKTKLQQCFAVFPRNDIRHKSDYASLLFGHIQVGIAMKLWSNQNKTLYPQPIQWRKGIMFSFGLACVMFYFAADVWMNEIDPCQRTNNKGCKIASFWAQLTGVSRYVADAQYWAALGLIILVISYQIWRHK